MIKKHLSINILTSIIILLFISCGLNNPFLPTNLIKHDSSSTLIPPNGNNQWTWVSGSNIAMQYGVYGIKGVADPANIPGARQYSVSWRDSNNNLCLFGGMGIGSSGAIGDINDLWKFDGTNWTWVSGSNIINQVGVYGTKKIANPTNIPGARHSAMTWIDLNNNLWLFGGSDYLATNTFNDLWKFDGTNWIWVSGSNLPGQAGVYGTKGVADSANIPGFRQQAITWRDSNNNLWLFGGLGLKNDLWKFDGNNWTWVSGSNLPGQAGVYGTKGVANPTNIPGGREFAVSWIDSDNNLWLFGGSGIDSTGTGGLLNDLWKFDGSNWTWVSGSNIVNQPTVYGTKGIPDPLNNPGAREFAVSWIDSNNNLWLFGYYNFPTLVGFSNDLWKFDGNNWTWVSGSNLINQIGIYGTKGIDSSINIPGARGDAISWRDSKNDLWLFGGQGYDSVGSGSLLNDLWKFSPKY